MAQRTSGNGQQHQLVTTGAEQNNDAASTTTTTNTHKTTNEAKPTSGRSTAGSPATTSTATPITTAATTHSRRKRPMRIDDAYYDLSGALQKYNKKSVRPYYDLFGLSTTPSIEYVHRGNTFVHTRPRSPTERQRQWSESYKQKRAVLSKGFFTPLNTSFRPIGDQIRTPFQLFHDSIGMNIGPDGRRVKDDVLLALAAATAAATAIPPPGKATTSGREMLSPPINSGTQEKIDVSLDPTAETTDEKQKKKRVPRALRLRGRIKPRPIRPLPQFVPICLLRRQGLDGGLQALLRLIEQNSRWELLLNSGLSLNVLLRRGARRPAFIERTKARGEESQYGFVPKPKTVGQVQDSIMQMASKANVRVPFRAPPQTPSAELMNDSPTEQTRNLPQRPASSRPARAVTFAANEEEKFSAKKRPASAGSFAAATNGKKRKPLNQKTDAQRTGQKCIATAASRSYAAKKDKELRKRNYEELIETALDRNPSASARIRAPSAELNDEELLLPEGSAHAHPVRDTKSAGFAEAKSSRSRIAAAQQSKVATESKKSLRQQNSRGAVQQSDSGGGGDNNARNLQAYRLYLRSLSVQFEREVAYLCQLLSVVSNIKQRDLAAKRPLSRAKTEKYKFSYHKRGGASAAAAASHVTHTETNSAAQFQPHGSSLDALQLGGAATAAFLPMLASHPEEDVTSVDAAAAEQQQPTQHSQRRNSGNISARNTITHKISQVMFANPELTDQHWCNNERVRAQLLSSGTSAFRDYFINWITRSTPWDPKEWGGGSFATSGVARQKLLAASGLLGGASTPATPAGLRPAAPEPSSHDAAAASLPAIPAKQQQDLHKTNSENRQVGNNKNQHKSGRSQSKDALANEFFADGIMSRRNLAAAAAADTLHMEEKVMVIRNSYEQVEASIRKKYHKLMHRLYDSQEQSIKRRFDLLKPEEVRIRSRRDTNPNSVGGGSTRSKQDMLLLQSGDESPQNQWVQDIVKMARALMHSDIEALRAKVRLYTNEDWSTYPHIHEKLTLAICSTSARELSDSAFQSAVRFFLSNMLLDADELVLRIAYQYRRCLAMLNNEDCLQPQQFDIPALERAEIYGRKRELYVQSKQTSSQRADSDEIESLSIVKVVANGMADTMNSAANTDASPEAAL